MSETCKRLTTNWDKKNIAKVFPELQVNADGNSTADTKMDYAGKTDLLETRNKFINEAAICGDPFKIILTRIMAKTQRTTNNFGGKSNKKRKMTKKRKSIKKRV